MGQSLAVLISKYDIKYHFKFYLSEQTISHTVDCSDTLLCKFFSINTPFNSWFQ